MKLEGVHHVTAITGKAQENVDFYAGTLGLRMVKKTVNQDDPTVYHLFYADEQGDAGSDITFFEYPGARPGRAGAGMVHTVGWRVASDEALDFWESGWGKPAASPSAATARCASRILRAGARAARLVGRRRAADRRPPRDAQRGRAAGVRRSPRLLGQPRRQPPAAGGSAQLRAPATAGRLEARVAAGSTPMTSPRPRRASQARAPSTTWPGPRRSTSTSAGASG